MPRFLHKLAFIILALSASALYAQMPSGYYDAARGKTGFCFIRLTEENGRWTK